MTDATLAAIAVEIDRLRERLRTNEVRQAAVLVLVDDKAYLSLKTASKAEAQQYLGNALLKLFVDSGLATQEEVDKV